MRRIVLDPSAFLAWFDSEAGRSLRAEYEDGSLGVIVPTRFELDVLEAAAGRGLAPDQLQQLAGLLPRLAFERRDAPAAELADWLARGTSGRHAAYAALAVALEVRLLTGDAELRRTAAPVAHGL